MYPYPASYLAGRLEVTYEESKLNLGGSVGAPLDLVWKLSMRNPSVYRRVPVGGLGLVWKLPMRNPSVTCSGVQGSHPLVWKLPMRNPSKVSSCSTTARRVRLEATYEESKQASEKIPAASKCRWRLVRSRPRWRAMRGAVRPWAARRTAWARRRTLKGTTGLRSTALQAQQSGQGL